MGTWLCIPRMKDLNENFRNWRVDWWGYIIERGICVWFAKDWSPFASDLWHWSENEKLIRGYQKKETPNTNRIIGILSKTYGFQGITYFDKFPDDDPEWKEYLQLKESKRTSMMESVRGPQDRLQEFVKNLLDSGMDRAEIIKRSKVPHSDVYRWFPVTQTQTPNTYIRTPRQDIFPPKESPVREIGKRRTIEGENGRN
jgi:hypothetical protein